MKLPTRPKYALPYQITRKGRSTGVATASEAAAGAYRALRRALHLTGLDLKQQIFGMTLGRLWLLLEPLLQALTYYFLIKIILGMTGTDVSFSWFLVSMVYWRSHASLTVAAPSFLTGKGYIYIDNGFGLNLALLEVYTQEISLFLIRFTVLVLFLGFTGGHVGFGSLGGLFVALCMFTFTAALGLWLSVAGVVIPDLGRLTAHAVWLWWYLSPGLYSMDSVPDWIEPVYRLNPFAYILPAANSVLLKGHIEPQQVLPLLVILGLSTVAIVIGTRTAQRFGYIAAKYI